MRAHYRQVFCCSSSHFIGRRRFSRLFCAHVLIVWIFIIVVVILCVLKIKCFKIIIFSVHAWKIMLYNLVAVHLWLLISMNDKSCIDATLTAELWVNGAAILGRARLAYKKWKGCLDKIIKFTLLKWFKWFTMYADFKNNLSPVTDIQTWKWFLVMWICENICLIWLNLWCSRKFKFDYL